MNNKTGQNLRNSYLEKYAKTLRDRLFLLHTSIQRRMSADLSGQQVRIQDGCWQHWIRL